MPMIPGTNVPLALYTPTGSRPALRNASEAAQRRGLLAMVHIAKEALGLNEGEYEMVLRPFKAASSGELTISQLERLIAYFKSIGWKHVKSLRKKKRPVGDPARLDALRARCVEIANNLEGDGQKRLAGLAGKICGTAQLAWCKDAAKLERLLAVLGKIKEEESHEPRKA